MGAKSSIGLLIFNVFLVGKVSSSKRPSDWWDNPFPTDILSLLKYQQHLQANNLIDSYTENRLYPCTDPKIGVFGRAPKFCSRIRNKYRRTDGKCNDFDNPAAGSRGYRFGHNIELSGINDKFCDINHPNPRMISRKLLQRKQFIPATTINILVPAWIQFMIHDWLDHGPNDFRRKHSVPLTADDPEFSGGTMDIPRTGTDDCSKYPDVFIEACKLVPNTPFCRKIPSFKTYQNAVTHWWDASQLYGSYKETTNRVRSFVDGKLKLSSDGGLPIDPATGLPITGNSNNWWTGLRMMHLLWTKEHNYICDKLKENNNWDDEQLFQTARLIVAAVIAKIHTIEWTGAILDNDIVKLGLRSNWYGITLLEFTNGNVALADALKQKFPELANGVPGAVGNAKNIRGVPYSLTEEFTAVYRLHPLLPDTFEVRNHQTGVIENEYNMTDAIFDKTENIFKVNSMENMFYSYGNDYPGAMKLHNYPNFLRNLDLPRFSIHGEGRIDLATIDILRDRERGIPRYNEFRRLLHLTPINTFEDLTTNQKEADELRDIYNDDVEQIDLLVGSLAEVPLPSGFGFSDTFFRLFTLMARRRLETDRFFTDDYTANLYTQWGLDYIDKTWMKDVLLHHYMSLTSNLQNVQNVFVPWKKQTINPT